MSSVAIAVGKFMYETRVVNEMRVREMEKYYFI